MLARAMVGTPTKILSIDGGGIRGIIPATVLADVERRTGRPVAETFDLRLTMMHYYGSHVHINPTRIVPLAPRMGWLHA